MMFHFPNEVDWTRFFRFDKKWIENMNWARISPAAKAVLPVIACHSNERGESFPGEVAVAALSGRTPKTVRHGIRDLDGFPGFTWQHYLTRQGKRGKRFRIEFAPKNEKGRSFFFHRGIIDGGIWCELKPTAQAIYPVLRYFARYDDDYDEDDDPPSEFIERYATRSWEMCSAEVVQLAKYAGVERHTVSEAMKNLQENFLLEPNGCGEWRVYIIPAKYWRAGYLNQKLRTEAGA